MTRNFNCGGRGCTAGPFTLDEVRAHAADCPFAAADDFVETAIERSKREIREDAGSVVNSRGDVMPLTVGSFSELHDYVDANEYGGICEDDLFDRIRELEEVTNRNLVDELQNAVDAWIKEGGVTAA